MDKILAFFGLCRVKKVRNITANMIKGSPSTSTNSAMDAIAALADKWCDSTNQPDSVCVALFQFTKWARQQHQ